MYRICKSLCFTVLTQNQHIFRMDVSNFRILNPKFDKHFSFGSSMYGMEIIENYD